MLGDREYDWLTHYKFDTLPDKEFIVQSITNNVKDSIDKIVLREIDSTDSSVPVPPVPPEPIEPDEPVITVTTPVISFSNNTVSITCSTDDATIYYTTDSSTPDSNSSVYTSSFSISSTCTVKAIAIVENTSSEVTSMLCEYIAPVLSIATPVISFANNRMVLTCSTLDTVICYTLDGSIPADGGYYSLYNGPEYFDESNDGMTVTARATNIYGAWSDYVTATFYYM